jgi:hypothetical protein
MQLRVVILLGLGCVACHGTRPLPAPPTVQYKARFEGALAASAFDSAQADAPFSEVADARGIPNLRTVQLPTDTREIRISDGSAMVTGGGAPVPMLRLVQTPQLVKGELYFFWRERPGAPRRYGPESGRRINCTVAERSIRTCVTLGQFERGVNWDAVAADLGRLGAWTLRDDCNAARTSYPDAGSLMIQRLTGRQFDKYACDAPLKRTDSQAGQTALAIYQYFLQLVARAS